MPNILPNILTGILLRIFLIATVAGLTMLPAAAQDYPSRPVRIVFPLAAGGGGDVFTRALADELQKVWHQPVVVENRPGAGSVLAAQAVATAPPNGYTMVMISSSTADVTALRSNVPYDLERDFAPISMVAKGPLVLVVNASSPVRSVKDLIALAKAQPGKLNIAHDGVGGVIHLAGAMFNAMAGVDLFFVPYKGGADSAVAIASGNVDVGLLSFPSAMPMIHANKIRPIAVTTRTRSSVMPSLPTIDEAGVPGYDHPIWLGLLAPAGTPPDVIARLNAAVGKAMQTADVKETSKSAGMEPDPGTPEELAAAIRDEIKRSRNLSRQTGIKLE